MKRVTSISLGSPLEDVDLTLPFMGRTVHVRRTGVNGDVARAESLLSQTPLGVDIVGIGGVRDHVVVGARTLKDRTTERLERATNGMPVTTGRGLRAICDDWAMRHAQEYLERAFFNARVLVFEGARDWRTATTLAEWTPNLFFADLIREFGVPHLLPSVRSLERYVEATHLLRGGALDWTLPLSRRVHARVARIALRRALRSAHVVVAAWNELEPFGREDLAGKIVVTSSIPDAVLPTFWERGVDIIVDRIPALLGTPLPVDLLDAAIMAALGRTPATVTADDHLGVLQDKNAAPRILYPGATPRRVSRFAFVIHPLSREHFKIVRAVKAISRVLPRGALEVFERVMAYMPPLVYSSVTGICSPQGVEAEGHLITLGGTPKQMLAHSPEFTYRRLLRAARIARRMGAQIMGLGAFTKVVGDAGVTVAKLAELPITTGNSYSASGALWAATDAARRIGLLTVDPDGRVAGKAMVVGATGAIGSVCARLLAKAMDEIHLVSPEPAKLLALRAKILAESPGVEVRIASRADENLRDIDVIVTATSGAGKKVLDIMKVKPGAVITDVARPLDLSPEDVAKRPDVLVIESGEIEIPGELRVREIGLPRGVVYACLAETIVLALEGRFEPYTLGRNIEWEKVKEIYRLGLKHGMRLAAIAGVNGVYTDEDVLRVRTAALEARAAAMRTAV